MDQPTSQSAQTTATTSSPSPSAASTHTTSAPEPTVAPPPTEGPVIKSSQRLKLVLGIVGVLILLIVGISVYQLSMNKKDTIIQDSYKKAIPTVVPSSTTGDVKSGDPELDQQSEDIDASMDKVTNDLNNVDKGLQDQPADLSQ